MNTVTNRIEVRSDGTGYRAVWLEGSDNWQRGVVWGPTSDDAAARAWRTFGSMPTLFYPDVRK